ncbi:ATP-binding cassette domain-containing protein [Pseudarthrobacter phenanthrenivorans]|uniref:ATP-binding cassette domain-containing protein n=1 Tax=Pseudarthrobacter phenanthrenivorans TaxID=361575 RepID=UPI002F34FEB4
MDEKPVIHIRGLKAGYGTNTVLEGINLDVYAGDSVALLGESGPGKTTLSRCIAGLHHDFSGSLSLDGEPLAPSSFKRSKEQRRRAPYIFQNPYESLNPAAPWRNSFDATSHSRSPCSNAAR